VGIRWRKGELLVCSVVFSDFRVRRLFKRSNRYLLTPNPVEMYRIKEFYLYVCTLYR